MSDLRYETELYANILSLYQGDLDAHVSSRCLERESVACRLYLSYTRCTP